MADSPFGAVPGIGYGSPQAVHAVVRLDDRGAVPVEARLAEEVPVALVYNRRPHVVMLCSPMDLEDFAVGFTLSEEIARPEEVRHVDVARHSRGVELSIEIPAEAAARLQGRTRSITGRTGCGLCGVEAIDDAVREPRPVRSRLALRAEALWRAKRALVGRQVLNRSTHATHAAAWASPAGELSVVREDVGRHNALDKVLGALARGHVDTGTGFVLITSRASVEMVQKAAVAGVPLVAALSRPTGLAVRMADLAGITLVVLLPGRTAHVYSHAARLLNPAP